MVTTIDPRRVYIVYDGDCPFCRNYVRLSNLRAAGAAVELVDARETGPIAQACVASGYDLDQGMVAIVDGRFYYGGDAVNRIALMSTASGIFNRLNRWIFSNPKVSRFLYPALRACRNATLRVLGVPPIRLTDHRTDAAKPD